MILLLSAAGMLSPASTQADASLSSLFRDANAAYAAKDYPRSVTLYKRLLRAGVHDPDVYINLGNAHAKQSQWGYARAYFERARYLRPADAAAQQGLAQVREALVQNYGEASDPPTGYVWSRAIIPVTGKALMLCLVLMTNLLCLSLALWRWLRQPRVRTTLMVLSVLGFVGVLVSGSLLILKQGFGDAQKLAVVVDEVALRDIPDARASEQRTLRPGQYARIDAKQGGYARVLVSETQSGWLPSRHLVLIAPAK